MRRVLLVHKDTIKVGKLELPHNNCSGRPFVLRKFFFMQEVDDGG